MCWGFHGARCLAHLCARRPSGSLGKNASAACACAGASMAQGACAFVRLRRLWPFRPCLLSTSRRFGRSAGYLSPPALPFFSFLLRFAPLSSSLLRFAPLPSSLLRFAPLSFSLLRFALIPPLCSASLRFPPLCSASLRFPPLCSASLRFPPLCSASLRCPPFCSASLRFPPLCSASLRWMPQRLANVLGLSCLIAPRVAFPRPPFFFLFFSFFLSLCAALPRCALRFNRAFPRVFLGGACSPPPPPAGV